MMEWMAAWAILGLLTPLQEASRVPDLIKKLEDDSFEAREKAERELVQLGEPALEKLRAAAGQAEQAKDRGELLLRIRSAIGKIELEQKARTVCAEPRLITLHAKEVPLALALEALARESGLKMEGREIDASQRVTIDADRAPLFQVLDGLCRGTETTTYEYKEAGAIHFLRQPHVAYPSAYAGPFRLRVLSERLERANDFKAKTALLYLWIDVDYEKYLKPFRKNEVTIEKARDDSGRALEVQIGDQPDTVVRVLGGRVAMNRVRVRIAVPGVVVESFHTFSLKNLTAESHRIWLEGTLKFSFPLDPSTIRFEKPTAGDTREAGEYSIKLLSQTGRPNWQLRFTRRSSQGEAGDGLDEDLDQRLDRESLVGVDEDGKEVKGSFSVSREAVAGGALRARALREELSGLTFETDFAALQGKPIKELRFHFIDKAFVKTAAWAIEGLELP